MNSGFSFENCSDAGGGKNAGYTDAGDYLEFPVKIAGKALYRITYRYSCNSASSRAELLLIDNTMQSLHTVDFASTGGWTTVGTLTTTVSLNAGSNTLKFSNSSAYAPDFDRVTVVKQ